MNTDVLTRRLTTLRRGLGLDHNPIRRRTDRIESMTILAAIFLVLASLPVALAIGFATHQHNMAIAAEQQATREQVAAVVTGSPVGTTEPGGATVFRAQAEWVTADRAVHTGVVTVPATATQESVVNIWTSSDGLPVDAPLSSESAILRGALAMVGTMAALALLLRIGVGIARWRLNRRRLLDWDMEWRRIAPQWT